MLTTITDRDARTKKLLWARVAVVVLVLVVCRRKGHWKKRRVGTNLKKTWAKM